MTRAPNLTSADALRGELQVTFEEGTSAAWLYDAETARDGIAGKRSAKECLHEERQPE
jgi:hypothetical protein